MRQALIKIYDARNTLLFFSSDDGSVVGGMHLARAGCMPERALEERLAELEAKVGNKTIEEQFREQAELIDRLFAYRFEEHDKKWDDKLDRKFEANLKPIRTDIVSLKTDVSALKRDVSSLKTDVSSLKTDVATLKDDVKTILERLT